MREWLKSALALLSAAVLCTGCVRDIEQSGAVASQIEISSEATLQAETAAQTEAAEKTSGYISMAELLDCNFFVERDFYIHIGQAAVYSCEAPLCGIVPHHLTAGRLIAGFLKAASEADRKISTVVITAPVHDPKSNKLLTTYCGYKTPFVRRKITAKLQKSSYPS